eukprot:TRINITY_DN54913_c0_g1_i1.p1 TRINITY_DN54913_c0_g1~~TRINITY_DN54913_c0_g1_i1.p1  ORF type:complete len:959 (-),score=124.53 TRINITY_DN54913_c0_g1_i1:649-3525(-)
MATDEQANLPLGTEDLVPAKVNMRDLLLPLLVQTEQSVTSPARQRSRVSRESSRFRVELSPHGESVSQRLRSPSHDDDERGRAVVRGRGGWRMLGPLSSSDSRATSPARFRRQRSTESQSIHDEVATPLLHRQKLKPRPPQVLFSAFGGPVADTMPFPHKSDCAHCGNDLAAEEARWGTGLCDKCWKICSRTCDICACRLTLVQMQTEMKICKVCYNSCDKTCQVCSQSLEVGQLHWGTGLCDDCYNSCEKNCRTCHARVRRNQLHWGTGLCDDCYNQTSKSCKICDTNLDMEQRRWGTGLCSPCYDASKTTCSVCSCTISLGSKHYATNICDACNDDGTRVEDSDHRFTDESVSVCKMCQGRIMEEELSWKTGLCDGCYNSSCKTCHICECNIEFGQLWWGTGLCDSCYSSCGKHCQMCNSALELGSAHYRTGLCDSCNLDKECRNCHCRMELGQKKWGTGLCHTCYESTRAGNEKAAEDSQSYSAGVRAAIGAQFVFYLAPGVMQPTLFLHIQSKKWGNSFGIYATVLSVASVFNMVAPIALGFLAERRGERAVYTLVALVGAAAGLIMSLIDLWWLFAVAWGMLAMPPAIRGVRAAFLARNVAPENLSQAGQLASASGLAGGFCGPLLSTVIYTCIGDEWWLSCFEVCSLLALVSHVGAAVALNTLMPESRQRIVNKTADAFASTLDKHLSNVCERCSRALSMNEKKYATSLCDACWDGYGGKNYRFGAYRRDILLSFCLIALSLEVSMNSGVTACFQPLATTEFGWGPTEIGMVNLAGSGLSVIVSFTLAQLKLPEREQTSVAAGLYIASVLLFTLPPLAGWRLVLGLMLGVKAQILFMSPFTALFSSLIGRVRVTNRLTTALCLAPAIGGALGTALAPLFLKVAGTPIFSLAALPASGALTFLCLGWRRWDASSRREGHKYHSDEQDVEGASSDCIANQAVADAVDAANRECR